MKIARLVGTASEILNIFVQNATVTTGAGLAGIIASSVSASWCRNDQTAASTVTMTSAASLGTFSSGGWKEVHTSFAIGWYQFGVPDGIFVSGRSALLHMYGAPSMAPLPIEIELTKTDNQTYFSSQSLSTNALVNVNLVLGSTPVTSAAGRFGVNVQQLMGSAPVTSGAGIQTVNLRDIHVAAAITTAAGIPSTDNRSIHGSATITSSPEIQTINLRDIYGSAVVTSGAGIQTINARDVHGSALVTTAAGVLATALDWGRTLNANSTQAFSSISFSSVPVTIGGVNMTSVAGSAVVTTAAGVVATALDWGRTLNANSTQAFSSVSFSSVPVTVAGVNVTSVVGTALVTSAAGIVATYLDLSRILNPTSPASLSGTTLSTYPTLSVSTIVANMSTANVSTVVNSVGSVTSTLAVNLTQIYGSPPVTTAAGIPSVDWRTVLGSTPVTSAAGRFGVNMQQLMGTAPVTSAAGIQTINLRDVHGSALVTTAAGVVATALDWGRTENANSTVAFSSVSFSSVPATVAGVNVTSVAGTAVVTSAAGVVATDFDLARILNATSTVSLSGLTVSTVLSPVNASTVGDKTGYRLDATGSAALTEGYAALGATGTLAQLLYEIRALLAEKSISGTTLTAKKLVGATTAETFTLDDATSPSSITRAS